MNKTISTQQLGTAPTACTRDTSEVQQQINTLADALANLEQVARVLDERLGPVYRSVPVAGINPEPTNTGPMSAVASQVCEAVHTTNLIALRIQQCIDLLAI